MSVLFKDQTLDKLAERGNVAQFISFRPQNGCLIQSFSRVHGHPANYEFSSAEAAVQALLAVSADRSVNVRSYIPANPRSREFVYGLKTVDDAVATLQRLSESDLHLIVNETINVNDGGVSGVVQGDVMEFAPDDTPRCVEKPGTASVPFDLGMKLLTAVYGVRPDIEARPDLRTEFSIHPEPRGFKNTNTILWEEEEDAPIDLKPSCTWPNRFSRHIGDKAFGLLVAHSLGALVPKTLVIGRRVAPFSFGTETHSGLRWTRTCPTEPQPGLFTTLKGWADPFKLLASEDPSGTSLSSVLCQDGVSARYSGAALVSSHKKLVVEGRRGEGDRFMLGLASPELLPSEVMQSVSAAYQMLASRLGPVRFEWVHDGERTWVVQLHCGATKTEADVIVPGAASRWVTFKVSDGLDRLRALLDDLPEKDGVIVEGNVGLTSHVADLLRKSKRPSRLQAQQELRFH